MPKLICLVPPAGWRCLREPGHLGPCAAVRDDPSNGVLIVALVALLILTFANAVHCQARWDGPRQTPAEGASLLRDCAACLANVANHVAIPEGPTVVVFGGEPGAASWMRFPAPGARLRLDGTPVWLSPAVYGLPFRYQMHRFEPFFRSEGVSKGGLSGGIGGHPTSARRWQ